MNNPILAPIEAHVIVEQIRSPDTLAWRDLRPGIPPDSIRADIILKVCGKEIRFPGVSYGFGFEPDSSFSFKATLQAVVALEEGREPCWRVTSGGALITILKLDRDPAERCEIFVYDDTHLYLTYHTNKGGAVAVDALLPIETIIEAEERATALLTLSLDQRDAYPAVNEWRSRYLGQWEHLKSRVRSLNGRLMSFVPPTEPQLF